MSQICVVTVDPGIAGGVRTKLIQFLRYAHSRGHVCDVFYPQETESPAAVLESLRAIGCVRALAGVRVARALPHFARSRAFARSLAMPARYDARQLVSAWLNLGVPLLGGGQPFAAWIAGAAAAEVRATPRTRPRHWYFYNPLTLSLLARQEARVGRGAAAILVDSHDSRENLQRELRLPPARLEVLATPVDLERFFPGTPVLQPRRYVICASRLFRGKGFGTLLEAFRTVVDRLGDVELCIAGDGSARAELEARARALGLAAQVCFAGWLSSEELAQLYRGATLFALASERETLCIAILEAMASGLPVVSTDCGGPSDHVVHGENGFLVPVGDARALAQRMIELLQNAQLARRMGGAGRARAAGSFGCEPIFAALDALYARVFGVHPGRQEPAA